jgi:hypothetical protein
MADSDEVLRSLGRASANPRVGDAIIKTKVLATFLLAFANIAILVIGDRYAGFGKSGRRFVGALCA